MIIILNKGFKFQLNPTVNLVTIDDFVYEVVRRNLTQKVVVFWLNLLMGFTLKMIIIMYRITLLAQKYQLIVWIIRVHTIGLGVIDCGCYDCNSWWGLCSHMPRNIVMWFNCFNNKYRSWFIVLGFVDTSSFDLLI